jgi:hypothetical protein
MIAWVSEHVPSFKVTLSDSHWVPSLVLVNFLLRNLRNLRMT